MALFSVNQIQNLFDIIEKQTAVFVASSIGPDYLSDKDKENLNKVGINHDELYSIAKDPIFLQYQLGAISKIIKGSALKELNYDELRRMVQKGQYVDLNAQEKAVLESIKRQSLADIKSHHGRIFSDLTGIVNQQELKGRIAQEEFLRNEIYEGKMRRESTRQIVSNIQKKTGDWSRDFSRIVDFVSHKAFEEGRGAMMRRMYGSEVSVWVHTQSGACKHCEKLYSTNGRNSAAKIFKLSDLEANGTNIGKKVADWLPVVPPAHPHCRCNIMVSEEKQKVDRKKIKIKIGEKEYMV
jgi:hypothetical protein